MEGHKHKVLCHGIMSIIPILSMCLIAIEIDHLYGICLILHSNAAIFLIPIQYLWKDVVLHNLQEESRESCFSLKLLTWTNHFIVFLLPFPESQIICQTAFSDWLLSFSNIRLRFIHNFNYMLMKFLANFSTDFLQKWNKKSQGRGLTELTGYSTVMTHHLEFRTTPWYWKLSCSVLLAAAVWPDPVSFSKSLSEAQWYRRFGRYLGIFFFYNFKYGLSIKYSIITPGY
jgi:hypothetical protein